MKRPSNALFFLLLIIIAGCKNVRTDRKEIIIKYFKPQEWKTDSIGCDKKRSALAAILLEDKKNLTNRSRSEITGLLGEPNFKSKDSTIYFYFIESGPQCMYVNSMGYDSIEVKKILVGFEKEIVKDVYMIVP